MSTINYQLSTMADESLHSYGFASLPPPDNSMSDSFSDSDNENHIDTAKQPTQQKPVTEWFPPDRRCPSTAPPRKGDPPKKKNNDSEAEASLIDLVRSHKCLWYEYHPERKNRDVVQAAWQTVYSHSDKTLFKSWQDAKAKFKNLRDYFFQVQRFVTKQPSGSGASSKKSWVHYDSLTFLLAAKSKDYQTQNRSVIVFSLTLSF